MHTRVLNDLKPEHPVNMSHHTCRSSISALPNTGPAMVHCGMLTNYYGFHIIKLNTAWWRHQMEAFSALLALCEGNSPVAPVNSPHKGQWHGALMFSLICAWTNGQTNHRDAGELRRHRSHNDVTVMLNADKKTLTPVYLCIRPQKLTSLDQPGAYFNIKITF